MKPAAAVLLLLLSPLDVFGLVLTQEDYIRPLAGEARTEEPEDADLPPELPLIWKELVGLRQLVLSLQTVMVDQRQALRTAESRLRDSQVEVEHQRQALDSLQVKVEADRKLLTELTRTLKGSQEWTAAAVGTSLNHTRAQSEGVKVRLSVLENLLEDLRRTKSVQSSQLSSMEVQLADSYNNTAMLQHKLNITDQKMNVLKTTTEELMLRVHVLEQHGQRSDDKGETKVAFAAALTDSGSVGPFDQETTLIFSKVFTNVGQAYDVTSGVFTAPVGGVYAFSFTAADFLKGYMGVTLYRNQQPIVFSLDLNDHGGYASVANGVLLGLEAGDHVRLSLPASYRLYDDARNFSVFSGFMLFAL